MYIYIYIHMYMYIYICGPAANSLAGLHVLAHRPADGPRECTRIQILVGTYRGPLLGAPSL